jgi:hypothetical protein
MSSRRNPPPLVREGRQTRGEEGRAVDGISAAPVVVVVVVHGTAVVGGVVTSTSPSGPVVTTGADGGGAAAHHRDGGGIVDGGPHRCRDADHHRAPILPFHSIVYRIGWLGALAEFSKLG